MRYLSICSGIEAASVAWERLGFTAAGFSEIDPFASAVLAERFGSNLPGEPLSRNAPPNFGDFTAIPLAALGPVDLLVGGTPCQAFSFAGKRLSLADARGNLTLAFAVLAHELAGSHGLRNALWENVPGVLSTPDNAFGCFLGAIVGADAPLDLPAGIGRWPDAGMVAGPRARAAWRVLDAQYFGLAQRRERVFVVVDFGSGADPAAVLFEPQGLQGNSPPRREAGQKPAPTVAGGARSRGGYSADDIPLVGGLAYGGGRRSGPIEVAATLTAKGHRGDFEVETFIADVAATLPAGGNATGGSRYPGTGAETAGTMLIAHTLRGEGFDASEDGTGRGIPLVPICFSSKDSSVNAGTIAPTLQAAAGRGHGAGLAIAFDPRQSDVLVYGDLTGPLDTKFPGPAIAFSCKDHGADAADDLAPTLRAMGHGESHANAGGQVAVAFAQNSRDEVRLQGGDGQIVGALAAEPGMKQTTYIQQGWAVRRLTPPECARLQGFPDHHSRIAWRGKPAELCPDGPQYKTYGNSMAVKVMRWLGERLAACQPERRSA